ncbi:hypothetical protein DIPPA_31809 [Diplonema papillatum]|nr:hypothetical protein DIPPA_31809 [Diplonema papillatum]|eukprot:gene1566-2349_t
MRIPSIVRTLAEVMEAHSDVWARIADPSARIGEFESRIVPTVTLLQYFVQMWLECRDLRVWEAKAAFFFQVCRQRSVPLTVYTIHRVAAALFVAADSLYHHRELKEYSDICGVDVDSLEELHAIFQEVHGAAVLTEDDVKAANEKLHEFRESARRVGEEKAVPVPEDCGEACPPARGSGRLAPLRAPVHIPVVGVKNLRRLRAQTDDVSLPSSASAASSPRLSSPGVSLSRVAVGFSHPHPRPLLAPLPRPSFACMPCPTPLPPLS